MRKLNVFIISFLSILIASCANDVVYDNSVVIDDKWNKNDYKTFEVNVNDTLSPFNFYINVRNSVDYRYANVYFFMETVFPNNQVSVDTIECILADKKGKWIGEGYGKYRDNQILLRRRGAFPMKGKYKFILKHGMRTDNLEGINAVGIRIEKFKPQN